MKCSAGRVLALLMSAAPLWSQGATVEGKVIDHVRARPIANAEVYLLGTVYSGSPRQNDIYRVVSDADGRFQIHDVIAGKYGIGAMREGYLRRDPHGREPSFTKELLLAAGEHATLEVRMIPASVIAGRVVDAEGEPMFGIQVSAQQFAYGSGTKKLTPVVAPVHADDRGEFRIFGLPPGRYYVVTEGRGWNPMPAGIEIRGTAPPSGMGATFFPDASDVARARLVEVAAGVEVRNVEIRVRREKVYSVRGLLPSPRPSSLSIRPRRADLHQRPEMVGDRFEFSGLLAGSYIVSAQRPDSANPGKLSYARRTIEITDHDVDGVTLNFSAGMEVAGTVQGVGGELTARQRSGMIRLRLEAPLSSSEPAFMGAPGAQVQADGSFVLHGVLPEVYEVEAATPPGTYLKGVTIGEKASADFRIDFSKTPGPITILVATDGATLEGDVKSAEGEAVKSALVTLVYGVQRPRTATTDEKGHFVIRDIIPGEYVVFAWSDAPQGAPLDAEFRKEYEKLGVAVKLEARGHETRELKGIIAGN